MIRGEIVGLRMPRGRRGSEQRGTRYAIIVQADELLALSTVLVSPTSRSASARTFRPTVEIDGQETRVLIEQTTAVATGRLGESAGRLSAPELRDVDAALGLVFGL